jgi:hypothetical protein
LVDADALTSHCPAVSPPLPSYRSVR